MENIQEKDFPGLYHCADSTSLRMQRVHYQILAVYSVLLLLGSLFAFWATAPDPVYKIVSAIIFLAALFLLIYRKWAKVEDIWYNGRAVAESVKTRTWRFMMRAIPYDTDDTTAHAIFIGNLKDILSQNESLVSKLGTKEAINTPVSLKMQEMRGLTVLERATVYKKQRIEDQEEWYIKKAIINKSFANRFFFASIILHALAIFFLLYNIKEPVTRFPISVIGVAASAILGWIQAKKYDELSSSYTLTAHEIAIIKSERIIIDSEQQLSEYVINCEAAFSREHTQWIARKRK